MANCRCIFCAGIAAVCSGTRSCGVCNCGFCCKPIQVSFELTEQDILEDQDRIAEFVENQLAREIWMAEADWLTVDDFLGFLADLPSAVIPFR